MKESAMDDFELKLNDLLVNTFRSILKVEEMALCGKSKSKLSISEMHMIEVIGKSELSELKVSTVSKLMNITLPSATVAINKLVEKGYLLKERCSKDGRVMYVSLTELGEKMNRAHAIFHNKMVREASKDMDEDEKRILLKGIEKLRSCLPATQITNDQLAEFIDTSNEWISTRTGILSRHIATEETLLDLAYGAAVKALEMADVKSEELDTIICTTVAGDYITPSMACLLNKRLGAPCRSFDLNAACSGFIYALEVAQVYIESGMANKILIVSAEGMSRLLNWEDRSTCVLFGDAAGAVVVGTGNDLLSVLTTAKGDESLLNIPGVSGNSPFDKVEKSESCLYMNGKEVYKFAIASICKDLEKVIHDAGISQDEVDYVLLHQANMRIIAGAQKRLSIPHEKYLANISHCGNTSSASIPVLLDEETRTGRFKKGIEYPVFQGGMAWIADASLASAVSNAGGLGIIAAGNAPAPVVRDEIKKTRELTDKPFGVNIMLMSPFAEEIACLVAEEKVKVVTTGAGLPSKYMPVWLEAGIKVIPVVPSTGIAKLVERAGASAVIAEGGESGGHIGEITTMALVPQVVDAVNIPVIAAGGIADGRGVAASFMLGAAGVQMGTRFLVARECTVHQNYKDKIIKAKDIDTISTAPKEVLSQTINTQPTLFCVDLAAAAVLNENGIKADMAAGFSLGEIPALGFCGALSYDDAFRLVCKRSELMNKCTDENKGEMTAVLNLTPEKIEELCVQAGNVYPVNYNCDSQTVAAGDSDGIVKLELLVKEAGGKARRLAVSGAFHSPFMGQAADSMEEYLKNIFLNDFAIPLYANATAEVYNDKGLIAKQINNPVRWNQTIRQMITDGADTFIEVGAGKVLSGLIRKIYKEAKVMHVEDKETLAEVLANVKSGREDAAAETVKEAESFGIIAKMYKCDVSDFIKSEETVKQIISDFGGIDILINNAGITRDKLIIQMKEEDFDKVMDVNLKGAFNMIKHVFSPMMKKRSGSIINITSVSGMMGNPGQANYSSAKAGMIGLTKTVAKEIASRKVRCNAIAPGFITTDMTDELPERIRESAIAGIPLGRMGSPEDVANLAVFLASDLSGYITGFMEKRVVVTGLGVVSPVGNDVGTFWKNIIEGNCGIDFITKFDASECKVRIAAEVKDFDPSPYLDKKEFKRFDLYSQYAVAAAVQAIEDSKIEESIDKERFGVYVGSGIGGINTFVTETEKLLTMGAKRVSALFIPMMISNMAAGNIAIKYGAKGPTLPVVTACATSTNTIGEAFRSIKHGYADAIIAGGSEASVCPLAMAGFTNSMALSESNDPLNSSIPFDKRRNGFVMGEGAGMLILEEYEHAKRRGAKIYAEVVGYGNTCDAYHITAPHPEAEGSAKAIELSMKEAGCEDETNIYINAHGTSTPLNDKTETLAIKKALKEKAEFAFISSTKSMTGHMLGAAGAVEAIASILALRNAILPPNIGYKEKDEECDLNYIINGAMHTSVNMALSISLGFGGHNACLAFRRYNEV
ncbi:polyketide synthase-related [Holotrichia oblita]|nr:polyketide synthase-related [Holotrichia oblita]